MTRQILSAALTLLFCTFPAYAGSVSVTVSDTNAKPAPQAVVVLVADSPSTLPASRVPAEAIIDQRHEMFIPLVSLIRKGGRVIFTNNDTTMHQVYSFSPIKQFEFEIDQGQRSEPVMFDKAGVSSIGCNIHDQMITYVYVADSPFAAITDAAGHAQFADVPAGAYHVNVWHPQLVPGKPAPSQALTVSNTGASLAIALPLLATPPSGMKHMHMGNY
jgi:plastocyanin